MQTTILVLSSLVAIRWALFLVDLAVGRRYTRFLDRVPMPPAEALAKFPPVSVIVPARNEARYIQEALQSVLSLQYPRLEVIAVNDRSEDATGTILDDLAQGNQRLVVEHVTTLPDGWLGKNHALQLGADRASGEILLFTDADVVFDPTVLARAVSCLQSGRLDNLTGSVDLRGPTIALRLFAATALLFIHTAYRPWRMGAPGQHRNGMAFGSFNLVRKDAYERAGTHRAIPLCADDDLRLGQRLARSGARQAYAVVTALAHVEWYASLSEAIRGLEKNTMAVLNFSPAMMVALPLMPLLLFVWPFVGAVVTGGVTQVLNGLGFVCLVAAQMYLLRSGSAGYWSALAVPVGAVLIVFAQMRAAILTFVRGGIYWRGTFYSLATLRGSAGKH